MATRISYDEYVDYICKKRGATRGQLFAWMREHELAISPCDCDDYPDCRGWVCKWPTPDEELDAIEGA